MEKLEVNCMTHRARLIIALLCLGLLSLGAVALPGQERLRSREYKILLKPEFFVSPEAGCAQFWALVETVGRQQNVVVKGPAQAESGLPDRTLFFLDTPDGDLYKKGFVQRVRLESLIGSGATFTGQLPEDAELTMKFRAPDLDNAAAAPVQPATSTADSSLELEEDVVIKDGRPVSFFSLSGRAYGPQFAPRNVQEMLEVFPGLKPLALSAGTVMAPMHGVMITERRCEAGGLKFGKTKARVLFTLWYRRGETVPFVAEFSFRYKLKKGAGRPDEFAAEVAQAQAFFLELHRQGAAMVSSQQTKTGLIFQISQPNQD